jgi:copper chaperone CopZ
MEDFVRRLRTVIIVLTVAVFAISLSSSAYAGGSCTAKTSKASAGCTKTTAAKSGCCPKSADKGKLAAGCTPAEKQLCNSTLAATAVNQSRLTLGVAYMTCDGCANAVNKSLQGVKGVQSVAVDYRSGTADVEFDSDLVSSAGLIKAIEGVGYHAQVGPYSEAELAKFADAGKSGK